MYVLMLQSRISFTKVFVILRQVSLAPPTRTSILRTSNMTVARIQKNDSFIKKMFRLLAIRHFYLISGVLGWAGRRYSILRRLLMVYSTSKNDR